MSLDVLVPLIVFGCLLGANIISLILAWVTPYGKEWIYRNMKTESKGYFIFWNCYMLLVGITFCGCALFERIRFGKKDYSEFKNVTPKQLIEKLKIAWAEKEAKKKKA